ncbi:nitric oxide synthase oxygenase [Paenibacillus sp. HB172176]|uniref:nitric oxide synthase oxygenase n=1 Tax=Paenibacillus sp. HB172176 TaxID=2493690 RepID=UPI00143C758A|nr:nitric oxide synthase oxygenase [Paenibacillus sp. HB172176]
MLETQRLMEEADAFIRLLHRERQLEDSWRDQRITEIHAEIQSSGSYAHTVEELAYGAKLAWRNNNRCIGRLFWDSLNVIDARRLQTEEEIAQALLAHIELATNGGKIRPLVTALRPASPGNEEIRILNYQLIRYAGYESADGIVGDPDSVALTKRCMELGWRGAGTNFDVLPLVIQIGDRKPRWFKIPDEIICEVDIVHPEIASFSELELQWYGVPIVSNMRLEIGGIHYTAAPFNGWYMGTEIGARNLADQSRYNKLPQVAELMGLDRSRESSLWRDKALVELNVAVLHSFKRQGVSIVDHHTAAHQFGRFEENERAAGRAITGNWVWLIPPVSPATTEIFHRPFDNTVVRPNFFNQAPVPILTRS